MEVYRLWSLSNNDVFVDCFLLVMLGGEGEQYNIPFEAQPVCTIARWQMLDGNYCKPIRSFSVQIQAGTCTSTGDAAENQVDFIVYT